MNISQIFIAVSIVVLAVIALLVFFVRTRNGRESRLSPFATLAFAFTLAGILFSDDRLIGYGLMGVGVVLAVADIFNRSEQTN
jgi:uncharacterized membrane protein